MIHGTPRDANSLSWVPNAARPSRTARRMLFSFMGRTRLPWRSTESMLRLLTPSSHSVLAEPPATRVRGEPALARIHGLQDALVHRVGKFAKHPAGRTPSR